MRFIRIGPKSPGHIVDEETKRSRCFHGIEVGREGSEVVEEGALGKSPNLCFTCVSRPRDTETYRRAKSGFWRRKSPPPGAAYRLTKEQRRLRQG